MQDSGFRVKGFRGFWGLEVIGPCQVSPVDGKLFQSRTENREGAHETISTLVMPHKAGKPQRALLGLSQSPCVPWQPCLLRAMNAALNSKPYRSETLDGYPYKISEIPKSGGQPHCSARWQSRRGVPSGP